MRHVTQWPRGTQRGRAKRDLDESKPKKDTHYKWVMSHMSQGANNEAKQKKDLQKV